MRHPLFLVSAMTMIAAPTIAAAPQPGSTLAAAVADARRPIADRARDVYRHPLDTLTFFGVAPGQTVVELFPSGGWYTRILAPLEAQGGHYIAVPSASEKSLADARKLVADNRAWFGSPTVTGWDAKVGGDFAPAGSVDRVLTFRNVHNLLMAGDGDGTAPAFFAAAFRALRPGGVLGIEEHRLPETMDGAREKTTGYVRRSTIVHLATAAGFRLGGESEINANPKDTHDWPKGVWTLPPTYQLGATDRDKYAGIGESDRLTLRFVKP